RDLPLQTPFIPALRNVPFEQQKQILFYVVDRLPRFAAGAMDATGNGAWLAEVAMQQYGATRIAEVKLSPEWYRQHMPRVVAAIEDRTITLPRDADIMADLRCLRRINGIIRVPDGVRVRGSDGRDRHGDPAIAPTMHQDAVAAKEPRPIELQSTGLG